MLHIGPALLRTHVGLAFALALCIPSVIQGAPVTIQLNAPTYAGQRVLLYRTMDLFTGRLELLTHTRVDDAGRATVEADVEGTVKGRLRIGEVNADLWLRAGSYTIDFPAPDPRLARSVNGTTSVDPIFHGLDAMDINALIGDLNERLDAFLAEDLATDQKAGMQAVDIARRGEGELLPDTARRPGTLFITPVFSAARVDTFERKLRRFYGDVKDPWFWQNLEYGVAGLRFGPRVNDRELFDRYLRNKPVLYDVPEYVRFISSFYAEHLMRGPFRTDERALMSAIDRVQLDSLVQLFRRNDLLNDARMAELVVLLELYANYHNKLFDRQDISALIDAIGNGSVHPEHRTVAANMRWDLTTMRVGSELPSLVLRSPEGMPVRTDTLMREHTLLVVTASWCTYCEKELVALDALRKEYGAFFNVVAIALDRDMGELENYQRKHPQRDWPWLFGGDDPTLADALRVKSIPAFYLLNGTRLTHAPAPSPTDRLAAVLHTLRANVMEREKLRPDDGSRAPKRR